MKRFWQLNSVKVCVLFLIAMALTAIVYPEVFITFKISFILWSDYCIDYPLTFVLTTFFYQGGVQLWDFFGQIPFFHTYAVFGLFKFPNIVTASMYYLFEPFSSDSAQLFHHLFAWANLMTLLLIRVIGIFLLLKTVTRNRIVLTAGTVIFAVFFSQWAFLKGGFYMSYYPLAMYFFVRFFQNFQKRYLAGGILFFMVCLGNGMHYGGYMYLPMHFFIISGLLWRLFIAREGGFSWRGLNFRGRWGYTAGVVLVGVLIMLPYLYIIKYGFPDLAFDQANSRISHPFSPFWYFHKLDLGLGDPSLFFVSFLDFQNSGDVYYFGWTFFILALIGLFFNHQRLKWLFGLGILFLWLLSFPREGLNIGLVAHWINALTNPLKAIARSYCYATQSMLAFLFMPLVIMGIDVLKELCKGKKYNIVTACLWIVTVLAFAWTNIFLFPTSVRVYAMVCSGGIIAVVAWVYLKSTALARLSLVLVVSFFILSEIALIVYRAKAQIARCEQKPKSFDVAPQAGVVGYDFENPSIYPFRNSYALHYSFRDEVYLWFPHSFSSDLHHVVNQGINYIFVNAYNPRHVEFLQWLRNPSMLRYLSQNNEFIFLASTAINASPEALTRIVKAGLSKKVVAVDDPQHLLKLSDQWPPGVGDDQPQEDLQYNQMSVNFNKNTVQSEYLPQKKIVIYTVPLAVDFPEHLASSWFPSDERYLRFFIEQGPSQSQSFVQAQGELVRPFTFDVQNIKKGKLKVAFPVGEEPRQHPYILAYPSSTNQGVVNLWRKQFDNLGITYRAKRAGWWVAHYPYDPKWRISVDGKPVAIYRVNETFIGFPLSAGEHKILIQYWPQSSLRFLLLISVLVTTAGLPILIILALRWEDEIDKKVDNNYSDCVKG